MAVALKRLYNFFQTTFEDHRDPNNEDLFCCTFTFLCTFIPAYFAIVKYIGPALMKNRQPFNLKNVLIFYNSIQIILNLYIFYQTIIVYLGSPDVICIQTTEDRVLLKLKREYLYLKILDCVETVFFVLRKSYRQISFLHLYHHSIILFAAWCGNRYYWGDSVVIIIFLNSFVHTVMFVYYLLTSLDPEWKKNLILKKNITLIQIVQLNIMWIYFIITLLKPNCVGKVDTFVAYLWIFNNIFMVILFIRFYIRTYINNKKTK
ncbi:elongation of very long chain fatty acids protein 7-like [Diorhabda carinulata]|uniref:elongation of very long chain fatty acids protein 7-like n=1 Tax=Diorhabda carinulata TaxID=1163345 RepID=UPI0025A1D0F6|nr:elongation of very long chain fatty acids protein 7-like [Diorhabda carinulata]